MLLLNNFIDAYNSPAKKKYIIHISLKKSKQIDN